MSPLETYAFAAILSAVPLKRGYDVNANIEHLRGLSSSIASSVTNYVDDVGFIGVGADKAAVLALVEIAWAESRFNRDIESCKVRGDDGASITTYQMMKPWAVSRLQTPLGKNALSGARRSALRWITIHTEKQVCSDPILAGGHALHIFGNHQALCKGGAPIDWFSAYGTGSCRKRAVTTTRRCTRWAVRANSMGLSTKSVTGDEKKISCWQRPGSITVDDAYDAELTIARLLGAHGVKEKR